MALSARSTEAEEMDGAAVPPEIYARCLADLAQINRITFTHAPTLAWLDRAMRGVTGPVRILDVACGHGDLLRAIALHARRRGWSVALEGLDLNPRSAIVAAAATPAELAIGWRTADVFGYAPDPKPDFIVTSQFAHHLPDAGIVELLRWLEQNAAKGWLIVDLQRHVLAYYGFRVLARLARWHRIVRQDGAISVASGLHRDEWRALVERAGVPAKIRWSLPFRFCVEHLK